MPRGARVRAWISTRELTSLTETTTPAARRPASPRRRSAEYAAVSTVLVLVAVVAALGAAPHTASTPLHGVTAWLANDRQGSVTQAGGLDGRPDARVTLPGAAGHRIKVIQHGSTVLIEDLTTGQVSSLDPNQLTLGSSARVSTAGTQIVTGDGIAYLIDAAAGTVQRIDPTRLTTIGAPLGRPALTAPLGTAQLAPDGTLWVPDDGSGRLVPVRGSTAGTPRHIGGAGDALDVTIAAGAPAVVDATAGTVTSFPSGAPVTVRLPVSGGAGAILQPATTDGAVIPLVVKGTNQLIVVDTAHGSAGTAAMSYLAGDRLDAPLMLGTRVYVPDESRGELVTYDTATRTQGASVPVDSRPGAIDAFVQNGELWANAPDDSRAVVVNADGTSYPIDKYQTGLAGGATSASSSSTSHAFQAGGAPPVPSSAPSSASRPVVVVAPPTSARPAAPTTTAVVAPPTTTGRTTAPPTTSAPPTTAPPTSTPPTTSPPTTAPPPVAPATVTETPGSGSISVTYTPVSNPAVTGYTLTGAPAGATVGPSDTIAAGGGTAFTVTGGMTCGTTYSFTVEADYPNGVTQGKAGSAVLSCTAPGTPANVNVSAASGTADQLDATWASGGDNGGTATYDVTANGNTTNTSGLNATLSGLTPGHQYTVSVTAKNAAGSSSTASGSGTPGGNASVSPDFTNFMGPSPLCSANPPVRSVCWFAIQSTANEGGEVAQAYPGDSFTAYCEASGTNITNTAGTSSTTWYYIAINGTYGFGNSLWWGQSGADGLPQCPSGL